VGTIVFGVDLGFNFELHVVSNRSNNIMVITELQVTAVIELDGVMVVCTGPGDNRTFTSTIQVASESVGELIIINSPNYQFKFEDPPAAPSGIMATNKQFTKTGVSVNVTWSTSSGADNYTVNVTPPQAIMPGQSSDFTTTETSLLLMLVYNVNYTINITAKNCAGSNSTVLTLTISKIC
jgi:hypothetical protein